MSIRSGFFNSIDGDRLYNADDMNRPYKDVISNGVFPNPSTNLQVYTSSGMTVQILEGGGMFGGGWAYNDAPVLLTLQAGETNLNRIDAIVIARDTSELVRATRVYVKKGTPASSPVAPTMERNEYLNEYCLATVRVNSGTTTLTQSMITDTRMNSDVCGWVTGLIEQVDTSTLFEQWQTAYEEQYESNTNAFNKWFADLQGLLADDDSARAEIVRLGTIKADKVSQTVTLSSGGWTLSGGVYTQTVTVNNLAETDLVFVTPTVASADAYANASIMATAQGTNSLTFRSKTAVAVDVIIVNMGTVV